jgi:hypothetical protein
MMCKDLFDHADRYVQSGVQAKDTADAGGDTSYFGVDELCFRDAETKKPASKRPVATKSSFRTGN